jgi:hypothetical protein
VFKSVPYEKDNCHQPSPYPGVLSFFTIYDVDGGDYAVS